MDLKKSEDEIDLTEFISIILKKKYHIFSIALIPTLLVFFYFLFFQKPSEQIFKTTTEIKPISTFEEIRYVDYNKLIEFFDKQESYSRPNANLNFIENRRSLETNSFINFSSILTSLDKQTLLDLFLEKIDQTNFKIRTIKEFELINKEKFNNIEDYESAVLNAANLINFSSTPISEDRLHKWYVHFETSNLDTYKNFLMSFEKAANLEIQIYLKDNFLNAIKSINSFLKYKIEDIEFDIEALSANSAEEKKYILSLKKYKQNLERDKTISRLEKSFKSTPVLDTKEFYASRFDIKTTDIKNLNVNRNNKFQIIILTAIISAILAIFYFIISNKIRPK